MPAARVNFRAEAGAAFHGVVEWHEALPDLPGRLQIRRRPRGAVLVDLSTELDGGLTFDGTQITISIDAAATAKLPTYRALVYDLRVGGNGERLLVGAFVFEPAVTAAAAP